MTPSTEKPWKVQSTTIHDYASKEDCECLSWTLRQAGLPLLLLPFFSVAHEIAIEHLCKLLFIFLGVAQNHSNLFMAARHRLPGFLQGQIYTYPSKRWRKKRRQYLSSFLQPRRGTVMPPKEAGDEAGEHFHTISTVENPAAVSVGQDEASKDSLKEDPKVQLCLHFKI